MTILRYKQGSREPAEGNHNHLEGDVLIECQFCQSTCRSVRERKSHDSQDIYMCCSNCNTPPPIDYDDDESDEQDDDWEGFTDAGGN